MKEIGDDMKHKVVAIIMAGGKGERFWPLSQPNKPKQFLTLGNHQLTLIQLTVNRLQSLIEVDDIYIATNELYITHIKEQLPLIKEENIIVEPVSKNTAPCVAFVAAIIQKKYNDALMVVLPADHLINDTKTFIKQLKNAINFASVNKAIMTIGMLPLYPETGYGYIKLGEEKKSGIYKVDSFVEKPNSELASKYVLSKEYLWNSGMFIFLTSVILESYKVHLPEVYELAMKIYNNDIKEDSKQIINDCFIQSPSISIDYGIFEKLKEVYTISGTFDWNDIGSFSSLSTIYPSNDDGNYISGDVRVENVKNSMIISHNQKIGVIGLDNIVVIETNDGILVCHKDQAQNVKKISKGFNK